MTIKLILLGILFAAIGCSAVIVYELKPTPQKPLVTPLPTSFFSMKNAPSDSIDGHIASMSGQVEWQSRVATIPAVLASAIPIQQGENIVTKKNGVMDLSFPRVGTLHINPNTQLNIIQTLPTSAVMEQPKGIIQYTKIGTTPLAIHSLGLLIQIASGAATVTTNEDQQTVTVALDTGAATVAYVDQENTSSVQNLHTGDTYIFHDDTKIGILR